MQMTGLLDIPALRPLPLKTRPYPDETTPSFIRRIELANHIGYGAVRELRNRTGRSWPETLAILSRNAVRTLVLAMPQLSAGTLLPESADRPACRATRIACSLCTLSRGAGNHVVVHTTHERVLCPRHRLWTGDGNAGTGTQVRLDTCPAILAAHRHHRNLITRFGRPAVLKAFEASSLINWQWYEKFGHFGCFTDRNMALTASGNVSQAPRPATVAAALYPSVVDLASALASPYWRSAAKSPDPAAFLERISSQITDGWIPQGFGDPLRRWMTQEKTVPTFTGPEATSPSAAQGTTHNALAATFTDLGQL